MHVHTDLSGIMCSQAALLHLVEDLGGHGKVSLSLNRFGLSGIALLLLSSREWCGNIVTFVSVSRFVCVCVHVRMYFSR